MSSCAKSFRRITARAGAAFIFAVGMSAVFAGSCRADDATQSADEAYKQMEQMLGGVPSFFKLFPKEAIAGAWAEERDLELSDKTALSPKVKALISLAVAAQIPCRYCVWADTRTARREGATEREIAEAVAMAALTRHWSTFFNGMQVDFDSFKKEMNALGQK